MGGSSVEEYKTKKPKNVTVPVYVAPSWRLDHSSDPNQLCQDWLSTLVINVITHAKFEINWYKIVPLAKGWNFMFQHYYGERH